jgi:uncharacterized protein (DUF433 family)
MCVEDRCFTMGILDLADAARFLGVRRSTFHRWALGYGRWGPLLHVIPAPAGQAQLTFPRCQPSKVVIDPYRAFGQPIFEGSRARVRDVAGMLKAGEDPAVVAEEHGVSIEDVRTAARVLLGRAP